MAVLAYAAAVTSRIRLGVAIINAPFVSPGYLAKQAASLDVLSQGRHDLGLGIGWKEEEFALTGAAMARRGPRTAEYITVLRTLWGDSSAGFDGEFYQVPPGDQSPKPVQAGGPPVLLGGMARPALERVGRVADGWVTSSRTDLSRVGELVDDRPRVGRSSRTGCGGAAGRGPRRGPGRGRGGGARTAAPCCCRAATPRSARTSGTGRPGRHRGVLRPELGPSDRRARR